MTRSGPRNRTDYAPGTCWERSNKGILFGHTFFTQARGPAASAAIVVVRPRCFGTRAHANANANACARTSVTTYCNCHLVRILLALLLAFALFIPRLFGQH
eukprot:5287242-Pleurochrysis_carterae.AAC.1